MIAIDAPWGNGKTWFARNWQVQLTDMGFVVRYIDAFESDYMEDPFSLIASEIAALVSADKKADFIEKATGVAVTIAPAMLKAAVNMSSKFLLNEADLTGKMSDIADQVANQAEASLAKLLEDRIKKYKEGKKSIAAFKAALSDFAGTTGDKPLVIMIDELDRCKPQFAVQLLERIKHFFECNNVVFVLLMNKDQMHHAIKGVYGESTDAHLYLEKFLNFTFRLPAPQHESTAKFIDRELDRYRLPPSATVNDCVECIYVLADLFQITPRQIERIIALLAITPPTSEGRLYAEMMIFKVAMPSYFNGMLSEDKSINGTISKIMAAYRPAYTNRQNAEYLIEYFIAVHNAIENRGIEQLNALKNTAGLTVERAMKIYSASAKRLNIELS